MSKPVKQLIRKELARRFQGVTSMAVVSLTGIDAVTTNRIRGRLREKEIRLMVVKNALARQAFDDVGLSEAKSLIDGPCAVAFGTDPVATTAVEVVKELLAIGKEAPNLTVKAAILEGKTFGPDGVEQLSKLPTRQEAVGRIVTCLLGAGAKLSGCLLGPAQTVAGLLKVIQERSESPAEPGQEQAA